MEEKINKLISLAYKNRFSLYCRPEECLVRIYYRDGSQHKESGSSLMEAIDKMLDFLVARDASTK